MTGSRRFAILAERNINKETFVEPWAEAGLMVTDSPYDPAASLRLENGLVVEMDGRQVSDFDALDLFIAAHALNLDVAANKARQLDIPAAINNSFGFGGHNVVLLFTKA